MMSTDIGAPSSPTPPPSSSSPGFSKPGAPFPKAERIGIDTLFPPPPSQDKYTPRYAPTPKRPPFFQGGIMRGILRMLRKTFLRPIRGLVLTVGSLFTPAAPYGLFMMGKYFVEGLVGVDSLFMRRNPLLNPLMPFKGRTLLDAFRGKK